MIKRSKPTPVKYLKSTRKGKKHKTELQIFNEYLSKRIASATMVSVATGIPQKNITRHKRFLEDKDLLMEITKKPCKITGRNVQYITTDPDRFQEAQLTNQLNLFK